MTDMDRRSLLKIAGATGLGVITAPNALDAVQIASRSKADETQNPPSRFFTPQEMRTVRVLVDDVIPRDEHSGSATDAKVPEFMESILTDDGLRRHPMTHTQMRGGLAWLDTESRRRFGKAYADCGARERHQLLDDIAYPAKASPEMRYGAEFFSKCRDFTAAGFFSSAMGYRDLQYKGLVFVPVWRGCPDAALKRIGVSYDEWDAKYAHLGDQWREGQAPAKPHDH